MFINNISSSKSDIIDQCLWRYYLKYVLKLKGDKAINEEDLNFGSYIHKIYELGYKSSSHKELHRIAEEVRPTYKIPYRENDRIKKCIENFILFNQNLGETISTEMVFKLFLDEKNDISFNGVIDRVIKGKDGGYLIIDYKTSKREKSKKDLLTNNQLMAYAYAIHMLYDVPIEKIWCAHYYPLTNNLVTVKFSKMQILSWKKKEIDKVWRIRKKKACEFYAQKNVLCNWCEMKSMCPNFNTQAEVDERIEEQKRIAKESKHALNITVDQENRNGAENNVV